MAGKKTASKKAKSFEESLWDTALHTVEKNNKALKGALPDNYFSRLGLDDSKLSALIDTINNIQTLYSQMKESEKLDAVIRKTLKGLGYGEA